MHASLGSRVYRYKRSCIPKPQTRNHEAPKEEPAVDTEDVAPDMPIVQHALPGSKHLKTRYYTLGAEM